MQRALLLFLTVLCLGSSALGKPSAEPVGPSASQASLDKQFSSLPGFLFATVRPRPTDYPPELLAKGEQGTTRLCVVIGDDDKVAIAFVIVSSGFPDLDAASVRFVRHNVDATSAHFNGKPAKSILAVAVTWSPKSDAPNAPAAPPATAAPPTASSAVDRTLEKRGAVLFEQDATNPTPTQFDGIRLLANDVRSALDGGAIKVVLRGYGGAAGDVSPEARSIALKRVKALRDLFISDGVPEERIEMIAMGGADDGGAPDRVDIYLRKN